MTAGTREASHGARRLDGTVAVVTGAASGIGRATVMALASDGATVVGVDRAPATDLEGPGVDTLVGDVSDAGDVSALRRTVQERHSRCDVLVNCAGVVATGSATECTEDEWERLFAVNSKGTWLMCREFLPLLEVHGGAIVNIASGLALRPIGTLAAYSASKAAVVALTQSIALEFGERGVRANCVCPGMIDTPMNTAAIEQRNPEEQAAARAFSAYALKRMGRPEEVAAAVVFLAAPQVGYVTGTNLAIDGGRTLH